MASVSRERDRARLEQELQTDDYQHLLGRLQRNELFFQQFGTWADVIAFMRSGTSSDPRKDDILRPIFEAHTEDQDSRLRAVLLVIFWPGLESIHFQKRGWDPDPHEQPLRAPPPSGRPSGTRGRARRRRRHDGRPPAPPAAGSTRPRRSRAASCLPRRGHAGRRRSRRRGARGRR